MTKDDAIKKLIECQEDWDTENAHGEADDTLCEFLIALGYPEVVEEWKKVSKWYA